MSEQDPIEFKSDGVELTLADGRTVRPVIKDSETDEEVIATEVHTIDKYAKYTTEIDTPGVYLWFDEIEENEA